MPISSRLVVNQAAYKTGRARLAELIGGLAAGGATMNASIAATPMRRIFEATLQQLIAHDTAPDQAIDERVRQILEDVRQRGDAALLEYTQRFDRIDAGAVADLEIGARPDAGGPGRARRPGSRRPAGGRRPRCARFHEQGSIGDWDVTRCRRHHAGQQRDAARPRRHLRARRQGGVSVFGADERHPGAVAGVRRDRHGGADARAGERNPLVLAAAAVPACTRASRSAARRRSPRWPTARRHAAGRQDRRPRQRLRGRRQAPRVRHSGHRHDRRTERNPGHRRRQAPSRTGSPWTCFRQAEHDELAQAILLCPDAPTSTGAPASNGCCRRCRARDIIAASLATAAR